MSKSVSEKKRWAKEKKLPDVLDIPHILDIPDVLYKGWATAKETYQYLILSYNVLFLKRHSRSLLLFSCKYVEIVSGYKPAIYKGDQP